MAVLKCKMCGGNLEVTEGQSYGTCDSCGSTMTLPKSNDERILNLFNRATHYRQQNEFDKALTTYESILEEDSENAEAYWGCVLSRYGIEYVEDTRTRERIPTCHRVQNESILVDLDYQKALKFASDNHSKEIYTKEAERISEIQKGILDIARNEKPYDVFICYKESDSKGQRTVDSTLAQDIYYQLTNEGYKVFFARITLEDKLGQEYEPYIFAALNSAKVMLVVGTKAEFFNAVWVKNEWARFLDISKKDKGKLIIPCYRDMDAYELPDELSMFQSQDMSKIGFIQDLIRGTKKVLSSNNEHVSTTYVQQTHDYNAESEALLKRAFLVIEEKDWEKADEILEKVLNINPENAQAYIGKLMIDARVTTEEGLENPRGLNAIRLEENKNYQKAIRFADDETRQRLEFYKDSINRRLNKTREEKQTNLNNERGKLFEEYKREFYKYKDMPKFSYTIPLTIGAIISIVLGLAFGGWVGDMWLGFVASYIPFSLIWSIIAFVGSAKNNKRIRQKILVNKLAGELYKNLLQMENRDLNSVETTVVDMSQNQFCCDNVNKLINHVIKTTNADYKTVKDIVDAVLNPREVVTK